MTKFDRLVECVPNFSEGRRQDIVERLANAVRAVEGVCLLDRHLDADHHRSVLTLAGLPEALAESAFHAARVGVELIELRHHEGGHPRVGAVDVIPFVPLRGVTMEDCVAIAKSVGQRIGVELHIPVFLYEEAATRWERRNLADIRRGGLQGLGARMGEDEAWQPDFGPRGLHPTAGATIVGARWPLVAFNVNLRTRNLEIARAIASKVRFSSGGLPGVKAIGVNLPSRHLVQVSMNLTDIGVTPVQDAFDAVRKEAAQRGIRVESSEIIGLVPRAGMRGATAESLCLQKSERTQILEERLQAALAEGTESRNEP